MNNIPNFSASPNKNEDICSPPDTFSGDVTTISAKGSRLVELVERVYSPAICVIAMTDHYV